MRRWEMITLLAGLVVFAGCKREIANRNLEQLRLNMSAKEVETILGQPTRVEKKDADKASQNVVYIYDQDGQTIVCPFLNGKLAKEPGRLKSH